MVPPIPMKPGGPTQDPAIRGYVRKDMQYVDSQLYWMSLPED